MASESKASERKRDQKSAAKKRTTKLAAPQAEAAAPQLLQLALADPAAVAPSILLSLQRSHGNRAVDRLVSRPQPDSKTGLNDSVPGQSVHSISAQSGPAAPTVFGQWTTPRSIIPLQRAEPPWAFVGLEADYVPPVAPPPDPPTKNRKIHRVGSPYRHLDGISNRKVQTKLSVGPARQPDAQAPTQLAERAKENKAELQLKRSDVADRRG